MAITMLTCTYLDRSYTPPFVYRRCMQHAGTVNMMLLHPLADRHTLPIKHRLHLGTTHHQPHNTLPIKHRLLLDTTHHQPHNTSFISLGHGFAAICRRLAFMAVSQVCCGEARPMLHVMPTLSCWQPFSTCYHTLCGPLLPAPCSQADWVVPSSREAVDGDSPWNQALRAHIPTAFLR
jgi:hypothetical protein